jgi:hypothetical protein
MQPCYGYDTERKFFFCGPQRFSSPTQVLAHMASLRERRTTAEDKVKRLEKEVKMWKQKAAKKPSRSPKWKSYKLRVLRNNLC